MGHTLGYYILADRGDINIYIYIFSHSILVDRGDDYLVIIYKLREDMYILLLHTSWQKRYSFSHCIQDDKRDIYIVNIY